MYACMLQPGLPLQMVKGAAITLGPVDAQQANPLHYKQTDETAKFEQVRQSARQQPTAQRAI